MKEIGESAAAAARQLFGNLVEHVPAFLGAVLLLVIGWLIARLLRALAARGMQVLEALVAKATGRSSRVGVLRSAEAFSTLIFWVVLLFFITAATHVLGLVTFTEWLARLLEYLPTLAAGLLIIAGGFILARFVGDFTHAAATRLDSSQRTALARLVQGFTLVAALLVGADQIGIRVTWIAIFAIIVIAAMLGGVALAVSLGARGYVSNLIGAHYLRQAFQVGESVRVCGFQGRILHVTATSLVLETQEGRVALPGRVFHEEAITLITRPSDG